MDRKTYIILSVSYAFLILLLSSISKPPSVEKPDFDKIEHVIEYSILGFLVLGCFEIKNELKIILFVVLVCSLYGVINEIYQYSIPGRYCSSLDMVANSIGSIFGVVIKLKFPKGLVRKFNVLSSSKSF